MAKDITGQSIRVENQRLFGNIKYNTSRLEKYVKALKSKPISKIQIMKNTGNQFIGAGLVGGSLVDKIIRTDPVRERINLYRPVNTGSTSVIKDRSHQVLGSKHPNIGGRQIITKNILHNKTKHFNF